MKLKHGLGSGGPKDLEVFDAHIEYKFNLLSYQKAIHGKVVFLS
jgi:hypothetical protein